MNAAARLPVVIANLDTVRRKNLLQIAGLAARGIAFTVITSDALGDSRERLAGVDAKLLVCSRARPRRDLVRHALACMRPARPVVAEIYPYGWMQLVLALLLRACGLATLAIARGEEFYYLRGGMPLGRRIAFRLTYAVVDVMVYKEPYMRELVERWGKRAVFLPNCARVDVPVNRRMDERACVFTFLNSIRAARHPETAVTAFLELARRRGLRPDSRVRLRVVGLLGEANSDPVGRAKEQRLRELVAGAGAPIDLEPWTNRSEEVLAATDVFVLPADVVFLNFTLLEAMARGIPAIVQRSAGATLIVRDGVEGILAGGSPAEWAAAMSRLIDSPADRIRMGEAARRRVVERYAERAYVDRYDRLYRATARWRRRVRARVRP